MVQRGTTAGKVFILHHIDELEKIPKGAILVAKPRLSPFRAGHPLRSTPSSPMWASPPATWPPSAGSSTSPPWSTPARPPLCCTHGQEVTLQAEESSEFIVYAGIVQNLLREERQGAAKLRELYEFRRQKYIMRYIAPLHLVNPLEQEFSPEKCRTVHDLIRFMHEKAVQALVASAAAKGRGLARFFGSRTALYRLVLPIPVQLLLIDLGGGLQRVAGQKKKDVDFDPGRLRAFTGGAFRHALSRGLAE